MSSFGRGLLQVAFALLLRPAIASQALTPYANFSIYSLVPPFNSVFNCNSSCQAEQRKALQLFYNETRGNNWKVSTAWNSLDVSSGSSDNQTHCNWFGISCCSVNNTVQGNGNTCNTPGGVASITLPNNNLDGTLSEDFIAAIEQTMTIIDLHGNSLYGHLPERPVGLDHPWMANLQSFNVARNNFSGPLASLATLSSMMLLDVTFNQLTGTIPQLMGMPYIFTLCLAANQFEGQLPTDWWQPPNLAFFTAEDNNLTGTISGPHFNWSEAVSYTHVPMVLDVSANSITGSIPPGLSYVPIRDLNLAANSLTGTLDGMAGIEALIRVRIDHNQLTGTIPSFSSTSLQGLSLQNNHFSGFIPAQIGSESDLRYFHVGSNVLSGALPESFSTLDQLQVLNIADVAMQHDLNNHNSRGEKLPEWLQFASRQGRQASLQDKMLCLPVVVASTELAALTSITMYPAYFHWQNCICAAGTKQATDANTGWQVCIPYSAVSNATVALSSAFAGTAFAMTAALYVIATRTRLFAKAVAWHKRHVPPGRTVTLVSTDIEGSTALYEWNPRVAAACNDLHDNLLRASLPEFFGYETGTEGDAFLLAFWEPADAVVWAICFQQMLMTGNWDHHHF
ncbi:hypothetical protein WJX74_005293 [Apatococcus lobatus]|uniref:Guanylate cyclase domain-containing protein n=1 Tax=Apatococcus lobatus TaxID=904363 RepID=A0AAW1QCD6_9CHLO